MQRCATTGSVLPATANRNHRTPLEGSGTSFSPFDWHSKRHSSTSPGPLLNKHLQGTECHHIDTFSSLNNAVKKGPRYNHSLQSQVLSMYIPILKIQIKHCTRFINVVKTWGFGIVLSQKDWGKATNWQGSRENWEKGDGHAFAAGTFYSTCQSSRWRDGKEAVNEERWVWGSISSLETGDSSISYLIQARCSKVVQKKKGYFTFFPYIRSMSVW